MQIKILQEVGYELAKYGFSLSYKDRAIKPEEWWTEDRSVHYDKVLQANANRGDGHNKFRRQIMLWVDIEAPRYWWSEFDTYKIGTVAQSESTMHTLSRRDLTEDDFEFIPAYFDLFNFNMYRAGMMEDKPTIQSLKAELPESYLQRRLVTMNYEVLATIINQRKSHKLPEWKQFIDAVYEQVEHPELLPKKEEQHV